LIPGGFFIEETFQYEPACYWWVNVNGRLRFIRQLIQRRIHRWAAYFTLHHARA